MANAKIRLYVDQPLGQGQSIVLNADQAHYLFSVMRLEQGAEIRVFNGADGEWIAKVTERRKRAGTLICLAHSAPQEDPPDLWLLFAPVKKARTDFIVEKATELGVSRILPVLTAHSNSDRIRRDRLQAHVVEAAEQCGSTYVPEVADLQKLNAVLSDWPADRALVFCDETDPGDGPKPVTDGPAAILIGPEGGFSDSERKRIGTVASAVPVSLGNRILRADTAAVTAISLWHSGIWRQSA